MKTGTASKKGLYRDTIDEGGHAFPMEQMNNTLIQQNMGMSLRDYFAAAAMSATDADEMTINQAKEVLGSKDYEWRDYPKLVAKRAYDYADAFLAERNREKV